MLIGEDTDRVIQEIGHDGSRIVHPDLPEPLNREGFRLTELIDAAAEFHYAIVDIQLDLVETKYHLGQSYKCEPRQTDFDRMQWYLSRNNALLILSNSISYSHAVAWCCPDQKIYNPDDTVQLLDYNDIEWCGIVYPIH